MAFDVESTGLDPATDRVVTATVVTITPGQPPQVRTWLADPGVEIPAEASAIHGISTEHARQHGRDAATVVAEIADALTEVWSPRVPLCVFNARFDLSLLTAELWRHHRRPFPVAGPVVDPMCLDRHLDRYRKGKRHLEALCEHYQVRLDHAHTSAGDALACARLAWRLAKRFPTEVGQVPLAELHERQGVWHAQQARGFADYLDRLAARASDPAEAAKLRSRAEGERAGADQWPVRAPSSTTLSEELGA
ncbi:DNA polymerase-3 subunit epsilon [Streptoalloteichus tenebrarius]|uniref:DNA polymerase-3 subunit epsilon n=1 Tax=Streptoalloteichus tenebrarius (strain ATCC 17920 / DSM 40477 / JCM 4838 / CBS 697.72 / NBRC 16177 / NCIMB 11028 / NRRL B-12390 / A12253. 1 / ISP 5477) TaxID=1933 RepID=A0ABT1HPX9_STRSD|nr:DNA polymerase-3 subunit epsilon [Streptoalloteichus tenebrarius]